MNSDFAALFPLDTRSHLRAMMESLDTDQGAQSHFWRTTGRNAIAQLLDEVEWEMPGFFLERYLFEDYARSAEYGRVNVEGLGPHQTRTPDYDKFMAKKSGLLTYNPGSYHTSSAPKPERRSIYRGFVSREDVTDMGGSVSM